MDWKDKIPYEQVESDPSKQDRLDGPIHRLIKLGVLTAEASQISDDGIYVTVGLAEPRDTAKLQVAGTISALEAAMDYELTTLGQVKALVTSGGIPSLKTINGETLVGVGDITIGAPTLQEVLDSEPFTIAIVQSVFQIGTALGSSFSNMSFTDSTFSIYSKDDNSWTDGEGQFHDENYNGEFSIANGRPAIIHRHGTDKAVSLSFRDPLYYQTDIYVPTSTELASGNTLAMSVNGIYADSTGNIVIGSSAGTPVSATESGIVNNIALQELGGVDKLINAVRIGKGNNNDPNSMALGLGALAVSTTGVYNLAVGREVMGKLTIGTDNTGIGMYSLYETTIGSYNTAVGGAALSLNTTGAYNNAFGSFAAYRNTTGQYNLAIGISSLESNQYGSQNVAVGGFALYKTVGTAGSDTFGNRCTAVGAKAMEKNTTGNGTAIGNEALFSQTTGIWNIAIGQKAGSAITTGSRNIIITANGINPNSGVTTGNDNLIISQNLGGLNYVISTASGNTVLGKVGPGLITDVNNQVYLADGTGTGTGVRFKSDTNGVCTVPTQSVANITGNVNGFAIITKGYIPTLFTSPAFTGIPTAPTAPIGTSTPQIATTAFVAAALAGQAGAFSGTPDTLAKFSVSGSSVEDSSIKDTDTLVTILNPLEVDSKVNDVSGIKLKKLKNKDTITEVLDTVPGGVSDMIISPYDSSIFLTSSGQNKVYRIDSAGVLSVYGNTGQNPQALAIGSDGTVYTADYDSNTVSKIDTNGVRTIMGSTGTRRPTSIAVTYGGTVYVLHRFDNGGLSKITADGTVTYITAPLFSPTGLVIDFNDNVYIANDSIIKVDPNDVVTTFAPSAGMPVDGITIDGDLNLYITRYQVNSVYKVDTYGTVTFLAKVSHSAFGAWDIVFKDGFLYVSTRWVSYAVYKLNTRGEIRYVAPLEEVPTAPFLIADGGSVISVVGSSGDVVKVTPYKTKLVSLSTEGEVILDDKFIYSDGVCAVPGNSVGALDADVEGKGIVTKEYLYTRVGSDIPASPTAPGKKGDIRSDATHIYWCTATDTWARAEKSAWT